MGETRWELHDGNALVGPLEEDHVVRMIGAGLPATTMVRPVGREKWKPVGSHMPFAEAMAAAARPVPIPAPPVQAPPPPAWSPPQQWQPPPFMPHQSSQPVPVRIVPQTSGCTWLVAAGAACFGLLVIIAATKSCLTRPSDDTTAPQPQVNVSPPSPVVPRGSDEVRIAIRLFWPHVLKAEGADWSWAGCHDKTVGFDEMRSCLDKARANVEAVKAALPATKFTTACGEETEQELRGFVTHTAERLAATLKWVDVHAAQLRPLMRTKSLSEVSDAAKRGIPIDETYGLISATDAPCIQQVLGCDGACGAPKMDRAAGIPSR